VEKAQRRSHPQLGAAGCIVALLLVFGGAWKLLEELAYSRSIDYSTRPPTQVFKLALGQNIPKGIKELRYAGHSGLLGIHTLVWMRFRFDDASLRILLKQRDPLTPEQAQRQLVFPSHGFRHVESDMSAVGWREVDSIEHPEYFQTGYSVPNSSEIWIGVLIVDRKRGLAYVYTDGN
jgi:hypothetical protein